MTDQEDYRKLPGILIGASAAVVPEQLGIWSYSVETSDADAASFNMVTAMTCRIHQSGQIDTLSETALDQVRDGIRIYKGSLREHVVNAVPFYTLGMPDVTDPKDPIAVGQEDHPDCVASQWRRNGRNSAHQRLASTHLSFESQNPNSRKRQIAVGSLSAPDDGLHPVDLNCRGLGGARSEHLAGHAANSHANWRCVCKRGARTWSGNEVRNAGC